MKSYDKRPPAQTSVDVAQGTIHLSTLRRFNIALIQIVKQYSGPDPGFFVGGAWTHFGGGLASNVGTFQ